MNENTIEAIAESTMDKLDAEYMAGDLTKEEYDSEVRFLRQWTEKKYRQLRLEASRTSVS
jgi:hypothetical protein